MRFTSVLVSALSASTALAAPASDALVERQDTSVIAIAQKTIGDAQTLIHSQVQQVVTLAITSILNNAVVPQIRSSLTAITDEVNNVRTSVQPLVTQVVQPLAAAELANVPFVLASAQGIVTDIETTATLLLTTLTPQAQTAVRAELQALLATLQPFTQPVIALSNAAIGTSTGPVVTTIQQTATTLNTLVTAVLAPIVAAVNKIT